MLFLLWDMVLLCLSRLASNSWGSSDSPALASWVVGLQVGNTTHKRCRLRLSSTELGLNVLAALLTQSAHNPLPKTPVTFIAGESW
jgi:hypothetical protein